MHHTATYCNTLQHTATHYNTLQHPETHCNTLQHTTTIVARMQMLLRNVRFGLARTATRCNTLQHAATACNTLQQLLQDCGCCCVMSDVGWSTLQHTAIHCNTLQHTATHFKNCCKNAVAPVHMWHDLFVWHMTHLHVQWWILGFQFFRFFFENRVSSWIAEIYRIFIFHNFSNAQRIDLICYWSTGGGLALWYLFHFVSSYFEKLPCGAAGGADLQSLD